MYVVVRCVSLMAAVCGSLCVTFCLWFVVRCWMVVVSCLPVFAAVFVVVRRCALFVVCCWVFDFCSLFVLLCGLCFLVLAVRL